MTVSANDRRIQYTTTASQTVFPYDFQIDANTEITVLQTIYLTGVTNTLTLTTHYTISGVGVAGGGNVTLVTGAAVDDIITIYGSTALTRPTDFNQAGDFFASDVNSQLDRITRILQENETTANRTLLLKQEDTSTSLELPIASDRASTFLAFDASGDPIASAGTTGVLVSTFMETLLDDTTAAAARATLGIAGVPIGLGTLAGVANTYTATSSAAYTTYTANDAFLFKVNVDNTGASTINVSSVGIKDLQKFNGAGAATALESGDLQADQDYTAVYNGTAVIVLNPQKPYISQTNIVSSATETVAGIAEIATQAETNTGADDLRFITPLKAGLQLKPTFSAYLSSNQALSSSTETRANFNTESWDTNSWYDNATNYRFTPLRAGYYLINSTITAVPSSDQAVLIETRIRKNGTVIDRSTVTGRAGTAPTAGANCSTIINMNGSTDYIDVAAFSSSTATIQGGANNTLFSAIFLGGL